MRIPVRILIACIIILIGYLFWVSSGILPFGGGGESGRDPKMNPKKIAEEQRVMSERVTFRTKDKVEIVGDYYSTKPAADGKKFQEGVLLLHMMPADRKSWVEFAKKLQEAGLPTLAIDLRGHGESQGGPNGFRKFSDAEHQASRLDIEAAETFFNREAVTLRYIVGASIGANLALLYASEHSGIKAVILLSPGLDYRGIKTESLIEQVGIRGIFLVASEEDEESYRAVHAFGQKIVFSASQVLKIFNNAGHGTTILERNPDFVEELVEWLKRF